MHAWSSPRPSTFHPAAAALYNAKNTNNNPPPILKVYGRKKLDLEIMNQVMGGESGICSQASPTSQKNCAWLGKVGRRLFPCSLQTMMQMGWWPRSMGLPVLLVLHAAITIFSELFHIIPMLSGFTHQSCPLGHHWHNWDKQCSL